uniref:Uncharacterized protein n=1 Tax=Cacopsylla melanoneura TaxID=428564 RepID=A0A8D8SQ34_9HEMI
MNPVVNEMIDLPFLLPYVYLFLKKYISFCTTFFIVPGLFPSLYSVLIYIYVPIFFYILAFSTLGLKINRTLPDYGDKNRRYLRVLERKKNHSWALFIHSQLRTLT